MGEIAAEVVRNIHPAAEGSAQSDFAVERLVGQLSSSLTDCSFNSSMVYSHELHWVPFWEVPI